MDERIVYASYFIIWILCAVKAFQNGWLSKKNITTLFYSAVIAVICGINLLLLIKGTLLIAFELYYVTSLILLHFIFRKVRRLQTDLFQFIVLTGLALPFGVIAFLFTFYVSIVSSDTY